MPGNSTDRKTRILDSASHLFVYYGYDKTTVSDIAREAGVSKGAIYLHFRSKDELLEALIIRETRTYAMQWLELIEDDPRGGTIGGMYRNMLYALNSSPFMAAMLKRDGRILGNYLRKPNNFFRQDQYRGLRREFLEIMQEQGIIRKEIDPQVLAHIINMLAFGLISMDDIIPPEEIPPVEDTIQGIADMMDRALSPPAGSDSDKGKAILKAFIARRQEQEANHENIH
ncbi:MAG: TetR/AcrR family transcriptional regulator [Candidatus Promineifilaceae bacterium]|nr:TetR/AcrR family transcriptional regulator [Candidatus Promineifilaceae bacterium]